MIWFAALGAGCAAALWWPSARWLTTSRLGVAARSWTVGVPVDSRVAATAAILAVVGVLTRLDGAHVLVGAAVALAGGTAARLTLAARARATAAARRAEAVEVVSLLAAELRAGALADHAVQAVATESGLIDAAARAAAQGADVVPALRHAGVAPGAELLADVASAWWVADRAGAPLSTVLGRLAERARDDLDLAVEVTAELGPARATARLMALLPAFGLLLGSGMGGDPVAVLLNTPLGGGCLLAGVALACAGLLWIERVASGVER